MKSCSLRLAEYNNQMSHEAPKHGPSVARRQFHWAKGHHNLIARRPAVLISVATFKNNQFGQKAVFAINCERNHVVASDWLQAESFNTEIVQTYSI